MIGMSTEQATVEEADKRSSMSGERFTDVVLGSPDYSSLADSIASNCGPLLSHGGTVLDLRCGRGDLIAALVPLTCGNCRFVAFDDDQANVDACADRFRWLAHQGFVQVSQKTLISDVPGVANCLTIEEFGLGWRGRQHAVELLGRSRERLPKGGAIVVAERADRPWAQMLHEAGFRNARRIWERGGYEAFLAEK
jgi:hypothetical protein